MPDPSSDDAAARLDNANPKLHQTVGERIISGKNYFSILFTYFSIFCVLILAHQNRHELKGGPLLILRAWEIA
jgi:hypothetical protein